MHRHMFITLLIPILLQLASSCSDYNCKNCTDNVNICIICKNNYYLNTTCLPCSLQIPTCSNCTYSDTDNSLTCNQCNSHYTINSTSNACIPCTLSSPLCSKCLIDPAEPSNLTCTECDASSSVMKDSQCQLCSAIVGNCSICSDNVIPEGKPLSCVSCTQGYYAKTDASECLQCGEVIADCDVC